MRQESAVSAARRASGGGHRSGPSPSAVRCRAVPRLLRSSSRARSARPPRAAAESATNPCHWRCLSWLESYAAGRRPTIGRWEYSTPLDPSSAKPPAHEARLVPAGVRLVELLLSQRPDPQQQVELVTQVCPHHLRAVRRDREADAVLDECPEDVPHGRLVGQSLRQE